MAFKHAIDTAYSNLYDTVEYLLSTNESSYTVPSLVKDLENDFISAFGDLSEEIYEKLWDFLECAYHWSLEGDYNATLYALDDFYAGIVALQTPKECLLECIKTFQCALIGKSFENCLRFMFFEKPYTLDKSKFLAVVFQPWLTDDPLNTTFDSDTILDCIVNR